MKLTINLKDVIYIAIIGILLWLSFRKTTPDNSGEVDRVRMERDSIIAAVIEKEKLAGDEYHRLADSCRALVNVYEKADSINRYKIRHEKAKVKYYTPVERSRAVDSILTSAGVRSRTR